MFWSFPYDDDHEATTLQKELKYFFEILRDIDQKAAFDTKRLFSPAFQKH